MKTNKQTQNTSINTGSGIMFLLYLQATINYKMPAFAVGLTRAQESIVDALHTHMCMCLRVNPWFWIVMSRLSLALTLYRTIEAQPKMKNHCENCLKHSKRICCWLELWRRNSKREFSIDADEFMLYTILHTIIL